MRRCVRETSDTVTLSLAPVNGDPLPKFLPGQFNMLYVHGIGEIPISISGLSRDGRAFCHTIRDVGPASKALRRLKNGHEIGLRGPFGTHWPVEKMYGKSVIVLAGGIGLAPLMPAIRQIVAERSRFAEVLVFCGARSPKDLLFASETGRWLKSKKVEISIAVDHATGVWAGRVGVVTTLLPRVLPNPIQTVAMLCGPEIVMRFAIADLKKLGVHAENIFLSMERNMKCALGICGHCQFNQHFICRDGAVFPLIQVEPFLTLREV